MFLGWPVFFSTGKHLALDIYDPAEEEGTDPGNLYTFFLLLSRNSEIGDIIPVLQMWELSD